MDRTRRAVLAMGVAGLASAAGCLGGGDGGDGSSGEGGGGSDGDGDGSGGESGPFAGVGDVSEVAREEEATLEVPAGEFEDFELEYEEAGGLAYGFENTQGFPVDVLIVRDGEFGYFEQGSEVNYNPNNSVQGQAQGSSTAGISSGSYHLVIDNSEMARAQPPTPSGELQEGTSTDSGTDSGTEAGTATGTDAGSEETATEAPTATEASSSVDSTTAVVEFSFQVGR